MSLFHYLASNKDGKINEGEIEADSQAAVLEYLEKHELMPVSVKEKKAAKKINLQIGLFDRINYLDKIVLTRNLATMIKAGIGMSDAVEIMLEDAQKPALKKIFSRAKTNLEKGLQLSETFAAYPQYFSPVFVNLVRAGEASGNLENALNQISEHLKKDSELRKKIRSAVAYPAVLMAASFGVMVMLVTVVLPKVSRVFAQSNIKLPFLTRALLNVSDIFMKNWITGIGILIFLAAAVFFIARSNAGKSFLFQIFGKTPLVKLLMQKIALTRFTSVLYSLLSSGMPIIKALEITADSVGNSAYKKIIQDMTKNEISKGVSFGGSLKRRPEYFPRLTTSMIAIGEKAGNLEMMLKTLSEFYEEEVDRVLKNMVSVLEPLLLLAIGLVILVLALSIIMPIYQMVGTIR